MPANTLTYSSSPSEYDDVSIPCKVPNVIICTEAFNDTVLAANPNAGILAASFASAFDTTVVLPEIPDI